MARCSRYESDWEAATLSKDATDILAQGEFPLRKWISPFPDVLITVPETERAVPNKVLESY